MLSITNVNVRYHKVKKATKAAIVSTLRPLQKHRYTLYDLQYVFLLGTFSFCYYIMDKPVWFKLPIALGALLLLIPRKTRHFMLPFSAIAAWLVMFYCCRFIPPEWRPHIFTSVLPALENILYGGNISELLASETTPFKDIMAWIPYGVLHFVLPFITAALIAYMGPKGSLPVFSRTFGYMNLAGVLTQLFFPCAPPWYETNYGEFKPATYSMPGSPGGLARVDDILGLSMYKSTFTASPLVFGAFPSLHSACAWQLAFFLVYLFGPRAIPFAGTYVFWIWWATMYLGHHYVVDLVGGAAYAVVAFWIGSFFLPSVLPQHHNAKASHVIHDLGDAMNYREKQTLFNAADDNDDDFVGFHKEKEWGQDEEDDEDTTEEMTKVVVVSVELETKETHSPASPKTTQSWNGWHGYESWMEVLATVNTPRSSPRSSPHSSPSSSPRGSITHTHGYVARHGQAARVSRESLHSVGSVTTLDLDQESNVAIVQASSSSSSSRRESTLHMAVIPTRATIQEDITSCSHEPKGRARPSRLVFEGTSGSSSSTPSSPSTDFSVETDIEQGSTGSSRPTSPRFLISGASSPALGKRLKDD